MQQNTTAKKQHIA